MNVFCTDDQISKQAIVLDSMLESMASPKKIMDFLTNQSSKMASDIVYASLLSDRMFNVNFLLRLDFGYASCLMKFLPLLDPFTRTHFVWQLLQCQRFKWHEAKFFDREINALRELARSDLTDDDISNHPYTGTMSSWLMEFDTCMFDAKTMQDATDAIPDDCFAHFDLYIKDSLWLSRIFQEDFFSASSPAKQIHMHRNLDKVPLLQALKFVAQILNSKADPMVKLSFWKKMNALDFLRDRQKAHPSEEIDYQYLYKKCSRCNSLFEAMFQFPNLYNEIYEAQASFSLSEACNSLKSEEDEHSIRQKIIDESSSYAEIAVNLTLIGEFLTAQDIEYMASKKRFNVIGEMIKDDFELVTNVFSDFAALFLILKYVKGSLCTDCLENFEKHKPGYIRNFKDHYGNNALWFLVHRKISGSKDAKNDVKMLESLLIEKYRCKPLESNIYGLCWSKMKDFLANSKKDDRR